MAGRADAGAGVLSARGRHGRAVPQAVIIGVLVAAATSLVLVHPVIGPAILCAAFLGLAAQRAGPVAALLAFALTWNLVNIDIVKIRALLPSGAYYASDAAVLLAIALLLATRGSRERRLDGHTGLWLALVVMLLVSGGLFAGLAHGQPLSRSLIGLRWLAYPVLAGLIFRLDEAKRALLFDRCVVLVWVGCLVTQVPVAAYQMLSRTPLAAPEFAGPAGQVVGAGVRAFGLMGWPTTLGLSLSVPCLYLLLKVIAGRSRRREQLALFVLLMTLGLTFSRGVAAAFMVGLVVGLRQLRASGYASSRSRHVVYLGALAAVAIVAAAGLSGLSSRSGDLDLGNYEQSVARGGRIAIVRVGLEVVKADPIWGIGPGRFGGGNGSTPDAGLERITGERILTAESSLLRVLVEQGGVGVVLLVGLGLTLRRRLRPEPSEVPVWALRRATASAALACFAVTTLIAPSLEIRQIALPAWILIGAALPLQRRIEERRAN